MALPEQGVQNKVQVNLYHGIDPHPKSGSRCKGSYLKMGSNIANHRHAALL